MLINNKRPVGLRAQLECAKFNLTVWTRPNYTPNLDFQLWLSIGVEYILSAYLEA